MADKTCHNPLYPPHRGTHISYSQIPSHMNPCIEYVRTPNTPSVHYPGTRRVVPGPVTTRSGTRRTYHPLGIKTRVPPELRVPGTIFLTIEEAVRVSNTFLLGSYTRFLGDVVRDIARGARKSPGARGPGFREERRKRTKNT